MANNPYVNKVIFGEETLIDLTSDTIVASALLTGYTAHDASGASITGNCTGVSITPPVTGERTFSVTVPNGTNNTITFVFHVDSNSNVTISES